MEPKNKIKIKLSGILGSIRMSQKELSDATGIRAATINKLYNEKASEISFKNLLAICEALNCSISDLFEIVPKDKDENNSIPHLDGLIFFIGD
ncbi:helix-turn-helix transcriptional regulator [Desulfosporosinus sp.]|uniref:helix-turn-helix domain-containing protein n=1 Tax=Desulfosporosinus sp. TaxID=157907 RepID=UPI00263072B6|nr:helix-turn-helix transcriptional regulator [Desulfosporosinus sp.]